MSLENNLKDLEHKKWKNRAKAAEELGKMRNSRAVDRLIAVAESDDEAKVRSSAVKALSMIGGSQAQQALERIRETDSDRSVRQDAEAGLERISSEDFTSADKARAQEDFRAFEAGEKKIGLITRLDEKLEIRLNAEGILVDEIGNPIEAIQGSGEIQIHNSGLRDRIWSITANLENLARCQPTDDYRFSEEVLVKEIEAGETESIPYVFDVEMPNVQLKASYWDPDRPDSPPAFVYGTETAVLMTLEIENGSEGPLKNIKLEKDVTEGTNIESTNAELGAARYDGGEEKIFWELEELAVGETAKLAVRFSVALPEGAAGYQTGETLMTYETLEHCLSGLDLKTITGSSNFFQYIDREEQEENPDNFDCSFELVNESEFEMDLKEIIIYEGSLEDNNIRVHWEGINFPEDLRTIDPGEVFKEIDPWTSTAEEPGMIPQFGRDIDLSVKYEHTSLTEVSMTVLSTELGFMAIELTKEYEKYAVPSFRVTEVMTTVAATSAGSVPFQYMQFKDQIPRGFLGPENDRITIRRQEDGAVLDPDYYTVSLSGYDPDAEKELTIVVENFEQTNLGPFDQNQILIFTYPIIAQKPRPLQEGEEGYVGTVFVEGNIEPATTPVTAEATPDPITVTHERRKAKIGKMIRATREVGGLNEFEITLRGENTGTAVIEKLQVSDFLPQGFRLASDTHEDPPVGFEEHTTVKDGKAMTWIFENVEPGAKVEVRFTIAGSGKYNPRDAQAMVLG
ncbi:MAG: HEAT repeat domain-containing protein [Candidatus Hodarchaeota archaeon]